MLLAISTTHSPATDLGYLLHKHPGRFQSFELSFGSAHVFYPECSAARTTAALLLDVDPVRMVRGRNQDQRNLLQHYVNDRLYASSSFMSVAIAQVFGSALAGRCKDRPELVDTPLPLSARLEVLPVRSGAEFLQEIFEPLGYQVTATQHPLDSRFPDWGESPYFSVELTGTKTLAELLAHLYVLIPVFDNAKHYYVGEDELEKLLAKGGSWLAEHPLRQRIARRYLRNRPSLYREALARLAEDAPEDLEELTDADTPREQPEDRVEKPLSLNDQRHGTVLATLRAAGAGSVIDLGCSEGRFLGRLLAEPQFERILGVDVSIQALQHAAQRLRYERLPERQQQRLELVHGSLAYRDRRLENFDAAALIEVIEHFDPPRLAALERVVFEFARPRTVIVTTPNREYNCLWETLPAGHLRHADHRFEWTRDEFQSWAARVAEAHSYQVRFVGIGPEHAEFGSPTQMGVFSLA